MTSISLNVSITFSNQDEFSRLLAKVIETQEAYAAALTKLSEFKPDVKAVTKGGANEQTDEEETPAS